MIGDWNGSYEQGHHHGFDAVRYHGDPLTPEQLMAMDADYRRGYDQGFKSAKRHRAAGRI